LEKVARERLTEEDFRRRVDIDVEANPEEATFRAFRSLRRIEPYGNGNPEPVFACRGVSLAAVVPTSKAEHAKVTLQTDDGPRPAMAFGFAEELDAYQPGDAVDVAFTMDENVFNGSASFRWLLCDVRPAGVAD
jgi:single-stranded-DNA-specific exonuclease